MERPDVCLWKWASSKMLRELNVKSQIVKSLEESRNEDIIECLYEERFSRLQSKLWIWFLIPCWLHSNILAVKRAPMAL